MKITMYELLGLVKDGKAPKKVKYKDKIYYYHEGYDFNYMYNSSDYMPMDEDKSLFTFPSYKPKDGVMCWDNNTAIDFLNDEVEILEDTNEITAEQMMMATDTLNRLKPTIIETTRNWNKAVEAIKNNFSTLKDTPKEEKKIPEKLDHLIGYDIQQFDDLKEYVEITTNDLFGKINKVIDTLDNLIDYLKSKGDE